MIMIILDVVSYPGLKVMIRLEESGDTTINTLIDGSTCSAVTDPRLVTVWNLVSKVQSKHHPVF